MYTPGFEIDIVPMMGEFFQYRSQIESLSDSATAIVVNDDATAGAATEIANTARKLKSKISKRLKEVLDPIEDAKKDVEGRVKQRLIDPLQSIESSVDGKLQPYLIEKDNQRRKAEREAQEKFEAQQRAISEENAKAEAALKAAEEKGDAEAANKAVEAIVETASAVMIPEIVPEKTKLTGVSGSSQVEWEYVATLDDPRNIDEQCVKARWEMLVKALVPYANNMIKMGFTSVPGFKITKQAVVKRRVR